MGAVAVTIEDSGYLEKTSVQGVFNACANRGSYGEVVCQWVQSWIIFVCFGEIKFQNDTYKSPSSLNFTVLRAVRGIQANLLVQYIITTTMGVGRTSFLPPSHCHFRHALVLEGKVQ